MKHENRIEKFLINMKSKVKKYIKVILKGILKDNKTDSFVNHKVERFNVNNYEKCRIEVTMQMQRDRNLF